MNTSSDGAAFAVQSPDSSLAPTPRRLPRWLPPLFYLAAASLFLWRSVFAGDVFLPAGLLGHIAPWKNHIGLETLPPWNPLRWDGIAQFYPWRHYAAQSVRAGTLPFWNPYQFCGTPFVANSQSAVFYPGNVLFYLLPNTARAFGYSTVLHLTLCGWFTYLLLRRLRCSEAAALTAGIVFAFSTWQVSWLQLPTFLATSCWLPLLLHQIYGLRQAFRPPAAAGSEQGEAAGPLTAVPRRDRTGRNGWLRSSFLASAAGIAAVIGMMLLAGHLQIAFYGLLAATLWTVGVLWRIRCEQGTAEALRGLLVSAVGLAIGLSLAASQILPTLELSHFSHRAGKPSSAGYTTYTETALPSSQLATLTLPDLFGGDTSADNPYWGFYLKVVKPGQTIAVKHNPAETATYVGIGTLGLGLLAFRRGLRRNGADRRVLFFAGLALLALLLALGTPLNALFYFGIPGFGQSGSPARCLVLWALAWAALAAFGLDALRERRPSRREIAVVLGGLSGVLALGLLLTFLTLALLPDGTRSIPTFAEALGRIGVGWVRLGLCLLGFAALLLWQPRASRTDPEAVNGLNRRALPILILITLDLFSVGILTNPTAPPSAVYPETAATRYLRENLGHERVFPVNQRWSLYTAPPAVLPPNAGMVYGIRDVQGYDSLFTGQYKNFANGFARPNAMGTLDASPPEVGNMVFFQNANAANVGVLGAAIVVSLPADSPGASPDSLPQTAPLPVADDSVTLTPLPAHPARAHLRTESASDAILWTEDSANRLRLTVTAQRAGALDIDDPVYPGWQARVDGKPSLIGRQESAPIFRSVNVPAGRHTVDFTYRPAALRVGLFLSFAAAAFLAFCAAPALANVRRQR